MKRIEFRYEFFEISGRLIAAQQPRRKHGMECAIGHIETLVFGQEKRVNKIMRLRIKPIGLLP
jgi:hypothetical protein